MVLKNNIRHCTSARSSGIIIFCYALYLPEMLGWNKRLPRVTIIPIKSSWTFIQLLSAAVMLEVGLVSVVSYYFRANMSKLLSLFMLPKENSSSKVAPYSLSYTTQCFTTWWLRSSFGLKPLFLEEQPLLLCLYL